MANMRRATTNIRNCDYPPKLLSVVATVRSYFEIPLKRHNYLMAITQVIQHTEDEAGHPKDKGNDADRFGERHEITNWRAPLLRASVLGVGFGSRERVCSFLLGHEERVIWIDVVLFFELGVELRLCNRVSVVNVRLAVNTIPREIWNRIASAADLAVIGTKVC